MQSEAPSVKRFLKIVLPLIGALALFWSFWASHGWLELCAGLALFLFGMQCLEEGLRQLAGSRLEQLLGRATATPFKGLMFGISGTMLLQSSTLVSLLTIAFISTGLIQLAGGIAILFGANLGSTSGIWLLALLGHNLSLSPLALPLLVVGVLAGFTGERGKGIGRVLLGIASSFSGSIRSRTVSPVSVARRTFPRTRAEGWPASWASSRSACWPPWCCSRATPR